MKLGSRSECTCVPPTVAPRASGAPCDLVDRHADRGRAHGVEALRELARGPARRVRLAALA